MAQKDYGIAEKIAKVAGIFLIVFIVFCAGFGVAQLDSVQRTQHYIASGESEAELLPYAQEPLDRQLTVSSTDKNALQGGALLLGPEYSNGLALMLVDETGRILHRWNVENKLYNPSILDWWKNVPLEEGFSIEDAHLLPGGDVIFIQLLMGQNAYRGQRLARMDKDSHIVWQVPGNFHHFIDIGGNPQKIYAFTSRLRSGFPGVGPALGNLRYLEDFIEVYSMDGKKTDEWSILEGFENSPYANWLSSFEINVPAIQRIVQPDGRVLYDLLHPNSIQYLDAANAKALPFAKEGDILLSFRDLSAIAVFHPATRQIVWAEKGPWHEQHNVHVGEDNRLYIFDNEGRQAVTLYSKKDAPPEQKFSRVIRFYPFTNRMDEIYAAPDIYSFYLGNYEPLADGSWIISSPQKGRVVVISPQKNVVWQMRTIPDLQRVMIPHRKELSFMHYYPASALGFLGPQDKSLP